MKSRELRNTRQRAVILDIIGKGHLDASRIYELARERRPSISLSTVYRTLKRLKEQGVLEELHFDEAHHHYELKSVGEHCHLVCLGCGKVEEFSFELGKVMKADILRKKGFTVTGAEMELQGYCARCRRALNTPADGRI
ncbi:MAG: transcriptional repressor [Chloroflexota bacterium]